MQLESVPCKFSYSMHVSCLRQNNRIYREHITIYCHHHFKWAIKKMLLLFSYNFRNYANAMLLKRKWRWDSKMLSKWHFSHVASLYSKWACFCVVIVIYSIFMATCGGWNIFLLSASFVYCIHCPAFTIKCKYFPLLVACSLVVYSHFSHKILYVITVDCMESSHLKMVHLLQFILWPLPLNKT